MAEQVTFRTTTENKERAKRLLPEPMSTASNFNQLLDAYENRESADEDLNTANKAKAALQKENAELKGQISELQKENEELQDDCSRFEKECETWKGVYSRLFSLLELGEDAGVNEVEDEIRAIQQRAMAVPAEVEKVVYAPYEMQENELLIALEEPHKSLLRETVKRLSAKLGKTVTEKDVLLDLFVRYTVEQIAEIDAFPFVIRPREFKDVTGYTEKEILSWLRAK